MEINKPDEWHGVWENDTSVAVVPLAEVELHNLYSIICCCFPAVEVHDKMLYLHKEIRN